MHKFMLFKFDNHKKYYEQKIQQNLWSTSI